MIMEDVKFNSNNSIVYQKVLDFVDFANHMCEMVTTMQQQIHKRSTQLLQPNY